MISFDLRCESVTYIAIIFFPLFLCMNDAMYVLHPSRISDQHQKPLPTSVADDKEESARGVIGRKRYSLSSQSDGCKVSRPLVRTLHTYVYCGLEVI